MSLKHAQEALDAVEATVSLNQPIGDDETQIGDLFADTGSADPEAAALDTLRGVAVRRAVEKLPERERKVVELRFGLDGEPMALDAIGRELEISRERVRQLEQAALARLAGELESVIAADAEDLARAA